MRILVTGSSGFIGRNFVRCFREAGHTALEHCGRSWGDLTAENAAHGVLASASPALVVHCAGMKDVRECGKHPTEAMKVNATATGMLALASFKKNAKFVYVSSNHLWSEGTLHTEKDEPAPNDWYGRSKLAGEQLAISECPPALVVRTAAVYGLGSPVLAWAEKTLREDGELVAWAGAWSSPTYVDDLAQAVLGLQARDHLGVWHFAGPDRVNRYQFFRQAQKVFGWSGKIRRRNTNGDLPADCSISSERAYRELGWKPASLSDNFKRML